MENIMNLGNESLIDFFKKRKIELDDSLIYNCNMERKKGKCLIAILTLIVAVISLIAMIAFGVSDYVTRYDAQAFADATSAGTMEFDFSSGESTTSTEFTADAGTIYFGYYQTNGSSITRYHIYYKKSTSRSYKSLKTVRCYESNVYYGGEYEMTSTSKARKYDVKTRKLNHKSTASNFFIDWIID